MQLETDPASADATGVGPAAPETVHLMFDIGLALYYFLLLSFTI